MSMQMKKFYIRAFEKQINIANNKIYKLIIHILEQYYKKTILEEYNERYFDHKIPIFDDLVERKRRRYTVNQVFKYVWNYIYRKKYKYHIEELMISEEDIKIFEYYFSIIPLYRKYNKKFLNNIADKNLEKILSQDNLNYSQSRLIALFYRNLLNKGFGSYLTSGNYFLIEKGKFNSKIKLINSEIQRTIHMNQPLFVNTNKTVTAYNCSPEPLFIPLPNTDITTSVVSFSKDTNELIVKKNGKIRKWNIEDTFSIDETVDRNNFINYLKLRIFSYYYEKNDNKNDNKNKDIPLGEFLYKKRYDSKETIDYWDQYLSLDVQYIRKNRYFHYYNDINYTPWPFYISMYLFLFCFTFLVFLNGIEFDLTLTVVTMLVVAIFDWVDDMIYDSNIFGKYTKKVRRSLVGGFLLFISSEALVFAGFLWAYFDRYFHTPGQLGGTFLPPGLMFPYSQGLPFHGTWVLLASSWAINNAYYFLRLGTVTLFEIWYILGSVTGAYFIIFIQMMEYINSVDMLSMSDSVLGSCFYLITGFHGLHVCIGLISLHVATLPATKLWVDRDTPLAFGLMVAYWHFVDWIWIFVYIFLYTLQ